MSTLALAPAGPVTTFVRRRPLTSFFLWFFTVGQAFAFLPLLVDVPYPQLVIDLSTVVGLLLSTVAITRIVDDPQGLRALLRSAFRWRVAPRWYANRIAAYVCSCAGAMPELPEELRRLLNPDPATPAEV